MLVFSVLGCSARPKTVKYTGKMAVRPGFEPGQRPPKGLVLPLHHRTKPPQASFRFRLAQRKTISAANTFSDGGPGARLFIGGFHWLPVGPADGSLRPEIAYSRMSH